MKHFSIWMVLAIYLGVASAAKAEDMVCFFTQKNYQGAHFCFRPGQQPPDLDAFPLSDGTYTKGQFGSILVEGSVAVDIYDAVDFETSREKPVSIYQSVPDLSTMWSSTILSVDVYTVTPAK